MRGSEEEDDEREDGQEDMFLDFLLGQGEWFYHIFLYFLRIFCPAVHCSEILKYIPPDETRRTFPDFADIFSSFPNNQI